METKSARAQDASRPPAQSVVPGPACESLAIKALRKEAVEIGSIEIATGWVWVDSAQTAGLERLGVIAHELIHLSGRSHVDPERFSETLMVAGGSEGLSAHVLHLLDREALQAVQGLIEAGATSGDIAEELGPWSDTSMHVRGEIGIGEQDVALGAASRNEPAAP